MTRRLSITSTANDRLKTARRLARGRRRHEAVFLIEGHRQLRCALEAGARVREVYAAPTLFLGREDGPLVDAVERRGALVYELGPAAFASISGQARPDGIAAVVERPATALGSIRVGPHPFLLVAQAIERPGNLGTILRTACAAGADAAIACDAVTDPFHPEIVRGSVGTLFHLPLAAATTAVALQWLRARGVRVLVASPGRGRPYWQADYSGALAAVVGNERHGVSRGWLDAADEVVHVPMPGPADSLNVAVAAGVVLFEAARRRGLAVA